MSSADNTWAKNAPKDFDAFLEGNYYKVRYIAGKFRAFAWINGEWVSSTRDPAEISAEYRSLPSGTNLRPRELASQYGLTPPKVRRPIRYVRNAPHPPKKERVKTSKKKETNK